MEIWDHFEIFDKTLYDLLKRYTSIWYKYHETILDHLKKEYIAFIKFWENWEKLTKNN